MKDSLLKKANAYLSSLNIMWHKTHNLHWNVKGCHFVGIHEFTDDLYEDLAEYFDLIAEMIVMRDEIPMSTTDEYKANSSIKEVETKTFKDCEVVEILDGDLEALIKEAYEVREEADKEGDATLVGALEDQIAAFQKQHWFVKAMRNK